MTNDREKAQQQRWEMEGDENSGKERVEQFNELSELSLEERMNVADRMGIPAESAGEAAATGTASGVDDAASGSNNQVETDPKREEAER